MVTLIVGLILLAVPFLLVGLFSDKKQGFIYILFFLLVFQSALGLFTQTFGIFYYWVIFSVTLVADIAILVIFLSPGNKLFSASRLPPLPILASGPRATKSSLPGGSLPGFLGKIDWVVLFVVIVSVLCLYQVHYNYTGKINIATDQTVSYHQVKNMVYSYPYFSDEWYAVSLVEGAINNHSLPVHNILDNSFFPNLELFFHSFVAEVVLLLGLNPLLNYTLLLVFFNSLIVLLIYLFLRLNNVPRLTSGISSLFALYITAGANLPGLWQFIPLNSGIIFFLLSLCFMGFANLRTVLLATIVSSLFYPPLIPFYFLAFLLFLLGKIKILDEKLFKTASYGILSLFFISPVLYIIVMLSPLAGVVSHIFSRIFFISFTAPNIPQLNFYNIIPASALLLVVFGLYYVCKNKKWILLSVFGLGVIYWFVYSFTLNRFFAEFERIVILTSIIVIIISGFGLKYLERYKIIKVLEVVALFAFLVLIPFYTQGENWKKIISIDPVNKQEIYPKSPANNYLTEDDLRIFKDIKNKTFLSLPWKGTVIGVATGNYPISTKAGTISIGSETMANVFLASDCQQKINMAKDFEIDYIYIYPFNCQGFGKIDQSNEGLILYKVL